MHRGQNIRDVEEFILTLWIISQYLYRPNEFDLLSLDIDVY